MKPLTNPSLAFFYMLSFFFLFSCQDTSKSDAAQQARESLETQQSPASQNPANAQTPPPISPNPSSTATAGAVQHYICPNNCDGSGGPSKGTCPVCGSEYQHNAAYHQQNNNSNATPTPAPAEGEVPQPQITQQPSPAQNAAGEYHYVCSAGCDGGAGAKGNCAKCGAALSHNAAYHQ